MEDKIKEIEELKERCVDFVGGKLVYVHPPAEEVLSSKAHSWSIPTIAYERAIKDVLEILRTE
ncbi:MAG TPA: hypothetical protein VF974_07440 [Patescibacteria group bacterium]